nr:hypothetical protein Iba_chr13aCG10080 [Ipomoea batatas]
MEFGSPEIQLRSVVPDLQVQQLCNFFVASLERNYTDSNLVYGSETINRKIVKVENNTCRDIKILNLPLFVGIEPSTTWLKATCSPTKLRWPLTS